MAEPQLPGYPTSLLGGKQSSSFMIPSKTPSQPADVDICTFQTHNQPFVSMLFLTIVLTWKSNIIDWPNVLKLYTSSKPLLSLTCMKNDIPNIAKMNITKNSRRQMLNSAGKDMASANNNVLIPLAPFTRRSTLPTFATLTTLNNVGDTKYFSIISLSTRPANTHLISYCCNAG